jgi:hypothetical protein
MTPRSLHFRPGRARSAANSLSIEGHGSRAQNGTGGIRRHPGFPDRHQLPPAVARRHRQILGRAATPIGFFATCPAAPSRGAQVVGSEGCRLTAARPAGERLMTAPGGIEPDGRGHSMISSARASTDGGIVRPRAFAVLRLTTRSNLVGCSTGSPAGVAPLTILSISCAAR